MFSTVYRGLSRSRVCPKARWASASPAYTRFPTEDPLFVALQGQTSPSELYKMTKEMIEAGKKIDGRLLGGVLYQLKDPKQIEEVLS